MGERLRTAPTPVGADGGRGPGGPVGASEAASGGGRPAERAARAEAALRILQAHPSLSDRAVAESTGLGARTVAELRRLSESVAESGFRIGRDGKSRPLNGAAGRLRVAELLGENPKASLRQLARTAGVSPATALDVRRRLERGEEPVPVKRAAIAPGVSPKGAAPAGGNGFAGGFGRTG
ncbi:MULTISPECIES: hypothetical protein [unclassified Kitasatospora]|uniref:hypothetical protein n=1 Tax=unclassified Kitasatospora TaxID=2633591 RepID=UPI0036B198B3